MVPPQPVERDGGEAEKRALDAVLASGLFDRSKSLSRILIYICTKYLHGQSHEIKEYNIAVEALGRPADFDQKKDAIVRVEMHRLRKRLKEYYSNGGANDPVWIQLPEKGYVPEFAVRNAGPPLEEVTEPQPASETPQEPSREAAGGPEILESIGASRRFPWIGMLAGLAGLGLVATLVLLIVDTRTAREPGAAAVPATALEGSKERPPAGVPVSSEIRILAGRRDGSFSDREGVAWEGDRYYKGGEAVATRSDIVTRGLDRNLFTGMREGDFEYAIPLKNGPHEMELLFAETQYGEGNPLGGGESSRTFSIHANGRRLVDGFDVLAYAGGPNVADSKLFRDIHPGPDGLLHLRFAPAPGRKAMVNAIRIRPAVAGRMRTIRITARPQMFRDAKGEWWQADRFYQGGLQILRPTAPWGTDEAYLYQGERYGDFVYSVPVPPGRYAATLYFWEYWWGKGAPGGGGVGSRSFDVFCNYRLLLSNFDVLRDGDAQHAAKRTFSGLEPNANGKLVFAFVPRKNFAMVNAIEIVDEGP